MKKRFESMKDDDLIEKVLGGVFSIVSIIAIVIEMNIAGFDSAAVAGGIKDFAGAMVALLVFIVAVKALRKGGKKDFISLYNREMDKLLIRYTPLLSRDYIENAKTEKEKSTQKKLERVERYNLAKNLGALFDEEPKYAAFCDVDKNLLNSITFSINNETFGFHTNNNDDQYNKKIIMLKLRERILNINRVHADDKDYKNNAPVKSVSNNYSVSGANIKVDFGRKLNSEADAKLLVEIIETVIIGILALSGGIKVIVKPEEIKELEQ